MAGSSSKYAPLADSIARKYGIDQAQFRKVAMSSMARTPSPAKPKAPKRAKAPKQQTATRGLSVATIDRFIPAGSPLARAGGARMLVQATGGNLAGAAFLAALARKESSFGAQAFAPNNFWGYGVHLGPDVNTAPTVAAMAARVWRGLSGNLYKGSGLVTPSAIINRYAPPSENNTSLYQSQVNSWFASMGLSPGTNIFGGPTVATSPGAGGAVPPTASSAPGAPEVQQVSGSLDAKRLMMLLNNQRARSLRGLMPGPGFRRELAKVAQQALPRAQVAATGAQVGAQATQAGRQVTTASGTYGFKTGAVDSGAVVPGGQGGDWGGSMPRALQLAHAVGATPSSQKRSRRLTASGGVSDHWTGSTTSYATDLPTSGAAGDALFQKIKSALGVNIVSGKWNNVNIGGYRYQIGWRVPGHYDHIHVGVKRL